MKVFISQSNYIPWIGFLDLIRHSDIYIVYDSMQFTKNDWRNRNLIANEKKVSWLSIPCGKSISRSIDEVFPVDNKWARKHLKTLSHCYSKFPYWQRFKDRISEAYNSLDQMSLTEINIHLLKLALDIEKINTPILRDQEVLDKASLFQLDRTDRLVTLCKELCADTYLAAPASRNYLQVNQFAKSNITVEYFDYPVYRSPLLQKQPLSWVDTCFRQGSLFNGYQRG